MTIGFIGLGKMGAGMTRRLLKSNHTVVAWNRTPAKLEAIIKDGVTPAHTIEELIAKLPKPRVIWLMVSAGSAVDEVVGHLLPHLESGDVIVDGGNSKFSDDQARQKHVADKGVTWVDAGVSGGIAGENDGYCIMLGSDKQEAIAHLKPILDDLASDNKSWEHVGPNGAGHFVKMVHNAIEYGMMQAFAEGYDLLKRGPYDKLDLLQVTQLWGKGSIVRSYLLQMIEQALESDVNLEKLEPFVAENGEGRWAVQTAIDHKVPFSVNAASVFSRFASQDDNSYALRLLAAMRQQFGGHAVQEVKIK